MAVRSISQDLRTFSVEDDKDSPRPTVFHVKQMTVRENFALQALMQKATETRRGEVVVNDAKLYRVMLEQWPQIVKRVEDFLVAPNTVVPNSQGQDENLYEKYKDLAKETDFEKDGSIWITVEDEKGIQDVMKMIPQAYRLEVLNFASEASSVGESEKN